MSLWLAIVVFIVSGAVMVKAATALAGYADQIAKRTKLSGLFVGSLMLAWVTSIPELVSEVTAARAGAPNLAVGDMLGSSMANMAILAIIDLLYRGKVWPSVELGHARVAAVAIALHSIITLTILTRSDIQIGWVGLTPILITVFYLVAVIWFRRMPLLARPGLEAPKIPMHKPTGWSAGAAELSMAGLWGRFGASALLILATAPIVTLSVKAMADATGIAQTFLGASLLGFTTSLPELISSIAAVRIGAYDIAVGNLFGSNTGNMAIVLFSDLAYTGGPILEAVSPTNAVTGVGAILLMAIAVAAIVGESEETRIRRLEPDAIVLLIAYVVTLTVVAFYG